MQVVLDTGVFTQRNKQTINDNFATLTNPDYWVRPQGPNARDTNPGTYESPWATMSGSARYLTPGIVIGLEGVLFQNWAPQNVNGITIRGMATQPRQATSSGIPNGGGATWLNPSTVASPLVTVGGNSSAISQAWRFENVFFNNAGDAACVKLVRSLAGADASHASFYGCKFTGADSGIQSVECSFVNVIGCEFYNFSGATDCGYESIAGDGVALPLQCNVVGNRFWNNTRHITGAFSSGNFESNVWGFIGSSITTTIIIDFTGGKNNTIWKNKIQAASDAQNITAAVTLGTADSYGPQYYTDKEEYATPSS